MTIEPLAQNRQDHRALLVKAHGLTIQHGNYSEDIGVRFRNADCRRAVVMQWLFDKQHRIVLRQSRKNLLGSLPNEIPAQMAVNDNWRSIAHNILGCSFYFSSEPQWIVHNYGGVPSWSVP